MKKNLGYSALVIVVLLVAGTVIYKYISKKEAEENKVYTLLPRKGAAANTPDFANTKKKAEASMAILKEDPDDMKANLQMSAIFIQEARETGNYMYYDRAAMRHVNTVLKNDPQNFTALVYKSLISLSQHHFAEGLAIANQASNINPYNAYVYGLMVDGNVEMGNYDSAVVYADKMVAIRPDLTSYSRISYLREIFGNYKAAIEAMEMAVEAGGRGDEHTEWTRVQLAKLYEKTGDYQKAEELYNYSLAVRPDYAFAVAGMARVALHKGFFDSSIVLYKKAAALTDDNSLKQELVEAYMAAGKRQEAASLSNEVIKELSADASAGEEDETLGHYADQELAYAYLHQGNVDKALTHALLEYNRRPANIDVNETLAWVYYNKGDYDKAVPYIEAALRTNSKSPVLLSRAGLIFHKTGKNNLAKSMLQQAWHSNSHLGYDLKEQTYNVLKVL